MRVGVLLHGGAAVEAPLVLHPTDRDAVLAAHGCGLDIVVLEALGGHGLPPRAVAEALALGASRAVRVADAARGFPDVSGVARPIAELVRRLAIDLVLFGEDADPEGATDAPAAIAHLLGARYVAGIDELSVVGRSGDEGGARDREPSAGGTTLGPTRDGRSTGPTLESAATERDVLVATLRSGGLLHRVRLSAPAVVGLAPRLRAARASARAAVEKAKPVPFSPNEQIAVLTLRDLGLNVTLVRRPTELRGVLESAPRPLVTLQSSARLAALLGL